MPELAEPANAVDPLPALRLRLDAVTLTFLAAGATIAVGVVGPLFAPANPLGSVGSVLASAMLDAIGVASVVMLAGWFALLVLYVANRSASRLAVRAVGWTLLTAAASITADMLLSLRVSVYGSGGSIGAFLRFALADRFAYPLPGLIVAATTFLGLLLTANGFVRMLGRFAVRVNAMGAMLGNRLLNAALRSWQTRRTVEEPILLEAVVPTPEPVPVPVVIAVSTPVSEPSVPSVSSASSESIPITRPVDITATPPPISDLPRDAVAVPPTPESPSAAYELPSLSLLADPDPFPVENHEQKLRDRATLLEKTFQDFGLNVKVVGIHTGPVITQYEVALETGLRLNKVTTLADDLSLNLGVQSIRIVAPLPGRTTVGVEVPNDHRQTVRLKELILGTTAKAAKFKLPVFLGKDVEGRPLVYDMATMPHLLIAGRTGTGKSVCLNTIILSFLFSREPEECRLLLIDPKKVEFSDYSHLPHLMHPVVTDDKKAEAILAWAVDKMEERYELLRRARVRNIASYNELGWDEILKRVDPQSEDERQALPRKMPYIVLVVDEVGDLLMSMKKEVESHIIRLAQKSRAAGIHLILATQKPTVDVITGLIKSNLPARVCFQVASRADSAVVLDEKGAEKLLGAGDMLFLQPGTSTIIRGQGAYVDDQEIQRVTASLEQYEPAFETELLNLQSKDQGNADGGSFVEKLRDRDALYEQAIEIVVREQRGSTSLLQRALGIGYGRASRLIDFMAEDGVVGSFNGSNARDVLLTPEEWESKRSGA